MKRRSSDLLSGSYESGRLVLVWHRAPELESIRAARDLLPESTDSVEAIDYLGVIHDATNFPSDAARKELAELLAHYPFRRVALVFTEGGFKAAIVRSIVSAMGLMSRKTTTQRVFQGIEDAAAWLSEDDATLRDFIDRATAHSSGNRPDRTQ